MAKQAPLGEIRYTVNGSEPTAKSAVYTDVLELPLPATLKAVAFHDGQPLSQVVTAHFDASTVAQQ